MTRDRAREAAFVGIASALVFAVACAEAPTRVEEPVEWPAYGGDAGGTRYSPAARIDHTNVERLVPAWSYRTGDVIEGRTRFEATPIYVDGTLYLSTPLGRVVALDPETGAERWTFDPEIDTGGDYGDFTNRGVSTWLDEAAPAGNACRRIIYAIAIDARLFALDAENGTLCAGFGEGGVVDLTADLYNPPGWLGEYAVTSPPAVLGDHVVIGSSIADNQRVDAPSGVVRALDARTGALRWSWDPIPRDPADPARATWEGESAERTGAANAWAPIAADAERDLVFVPTGSPSPDFYGGERIGENRHANSVIALRGATGDVVWSFQVVHHDVWDYDVASQPVLVTLTRGGAPVPAVVVATKMGHLFVLDRDTGEPLFPVEERAVPASDVPGEATWPTQPFPTVPAPLVPAGLSAADAWGIDEASRAACRARLEGKRSEGIFTPPSLQGTILFPGNLGGANWSSASWDPARGILVVPTNRLPFLVTLVPADRIEAMEEEGPDVSPQHGTPYGMAREVALSPSGLPCNPPPWGTLTALDLATGAVRWEIPHGYFPGLPDSTAARSWGSLILGGAALTASGLVFAAGTHDDHLYAYDVETGDELWRGELPAGGNATPMTYVTRSGRQFVVIAAGGHGDARTKQGDWVVAFALPEDVVETAPSSTSLGGTFEGHLLVGDGRYGVRIFLEEDRGGIRGRLQGVGNDLSGTIVGGRDDARVRLEVAFRLPSEQCEGRIDAAAELSVDARVLVGDVEVSGACADDGVERGTISVRRKFDAP